MSVVRERMCVCECECECSEKACVCVCLDRDCVSVLFWLPSNWEPKPHREINCAMVLTAFAKELRTTTSSGGERNRVTRKGLTRLYYF